MSRFIVEVLPEAEAEFDEAFDWYFERSPFAADAFRAEVIAAIDGSPSALIFGPPTRTAFTFACWTGFPTPSGTT